jgi:hypothetical protein
MSTRFWEDGEECNQIIIAASDAEILTQLF